MESVSVLKAKKVSRVIYTARRSLKRSDGIDVPKPVGIKMFSVNGVCHIVAAFSGGQIREFRGTNWDKTIKDCLRWSNEHVADKDLDASAKWRIERALIV
eukprot:289800_1